MANALLLAKAAAAVAADERTRKAVGWLIMAILSPLILIAALLCSLTSAVAGHNTAVVELCFSGKSIPADVPTEYHKQIEDMQNQLALLDGQIDESLDANLVKAIFYALYFGEDGPVDLEQFLNCFECAANTEDIYENIQTDLGIQVTQEQRQIANSVYSLIGTAYIGADGLCSPVGANWRNIVTSEFGWRQDPFTGKSSGHSGIDLAVPTGTPVHAALPGTVITSTYNKSGYGYYVMIDHGNGLVTLYAHCSQLTARMGQTVETGDVIALSGSTGRSTGPHLHFEVRLNGERTNPRYYLP